MAVDFSSIPKMVFSSLGLLITGLFFTGAFIKKRFICLFCPMSGLHYIFSRASLLRLTKNADKCTRCGNCYRACDMGIRAIADDLEHKNIVKDDCMMCLKCVEVCPEDKCLQVHFVGLPVFESAGKGFFKRTKGKYNGNERAKAVQRTTRLHLGMEAVETLRQIEEFPENPLSMEYFYNFFRQLFSGDSILPENKQVISTMCVQVPDELIYAAGAVPFRLCSGAYAYDQIGADFMPAKSCPVVRATTGMLHINQKSWQDKPAAVVIPTTCDQKKKAAEQIGDLSYTVYSLEMPSSKESDAAKFYWQESVKQFALDLQKITGKRITRKNLRKAIAKKSEAAQLYRRLYKLRMSNSPVIFGKDMLLVTNCFFMDDIDSWIDSGESTPGRA